MTKRISTKKIFQKGRFLLRDVNIKLESGKKVTFQFWDKADSAIIVPVLDNGDVILIKEYQAAFDIPMLSLPKGRVEKNEDPIEVANKELQEEIGYKANSLKKLTTVTINPGYISGETHIYLARDLVESRLEGDEVWEITISKHPLKNFEKLIDKGELTEARIITALYEARRFLGSSS